MKNLLSMSMLAMLALTGIPAIAQDAPATTDASPAVSEKKPGRFAGKRGGHGQPGARHGKLMSMLNDEQKEKFKAIMEAARQENQPLFEKMKALRTEGKAKGSFDEKSKAEFMALRKQLKAKRKETHEKILALLTPEQKIEFEKNKEQFGKQRGEFGRRKHLRGDGGGAAPAEAAPATPAAQ